MPSKYLYKLFKYIFKQISEIQYLHEGLTHAHANMTSAQHCSTQHLNITEYSVRESSNDINIPTQYIVLDKGITSLGLTRSCCTFSS